MIDKFLSSGIKKKNYHKKKRRKHKKNKMRRGRSGIQIKSSQTKCRLNSHPRKNNQKHQNIVCRSFIKDKKCQKSCDEKNDRNINGEIFYHLKAINVNLIIGEHCKKYL